MRIAFQRIGAWEDWPKADQERYLDLKRRINELKERLPVDDYRWFMQHYDSMKFFRNLRTRYSIRQHACFGPGQMAVRGFNTATR